MTRKYRTSGNDTVEIIEIDSEDDNAVRYGGGCVEWKSSAGIAWHDTWEEAIQQLEASCESDIKAFQLKIDELERITLRLKNSMIMGSIHARRGLITF